MSNLKAEQVVVDDAVATEFEVEPPLKGSTSYGLNPDWITWHANKNNCKFWKSINVGKRLLREERLRKKIEKQQQSK